MSLPAVPKLPDKATKNVATLLSSLKKEDGKNLLTKEQADALSALKLSNGENLLLQDDRYFLLEVAHMVDKIGYDKTYQYLNINWKEKLGGLKDVRNKILFLSPLMQSARDKAQIDMEIYRNKTDVVVGGEDCPKCSASTVISTESQNRSCDEPVSIRCTCLSCGYKWRAQ